MNKMILIFLLFSLNAFAELKNLGEVIPGVYRSAAPSDESDFIQMQGLGISTIINLEYYHRSPQKFCDKYQIDCLSYPIFIMPIYFGDRWINYQTLAAAYQEAKRILANKGGNILIHCRMGADRTGALSAALTIGEVACNGHYDKASLLVHVKQDLSKHGIHSGAYAKLYQTILSWVDNPPEWICNEQY